MGSKPIGILGGTFDPIHLGHLVLAEEAYKQCGLQQVRFMPCCQSPHKKLPIAGGGERLSMVKLAIQGRSEFGADDRELIRGGISYMVDSLQEIRKEAGDMSVCLIMSMDAFAKFNLWCKWEEIIKLAHLVVANRPESRPVKHESLINLLQQRQIFAADKLQFAAAGYIFFINIHPNPISATEIRALIKAGKDASRMLPKKVWKFITERKLYYNDLAPLQMNV